MDIQQSIGLLEPDRLLAKNCNFTRCHKRIGQSYKTLTVFQGVNGDGK